MGHYMYFYEHYDSCIYYSMHSNINPYQGAFMVTSIANIAVWKCLWAEWYKVFVVCNISCELNHRHTYCIQGKTIDFPISPSQK